MEFPYGLGPGQGAGGVPSTRSLRLHDPKAARSRVPGSAAMRTRLASRHPLITLSLASIFPGSLYCRSSSSSSLSHSHTQLPSQQMGCAGVRIVCSSPSLKEFSCAAAALVRRCCVTASAFTPSTSGLGGKLLGRVVLEYASCRTKVRTSSAIVFQSQINRSVCVLPH